MGDCNRFTDPIAGSSDTITFPTASNLLSDLYPFDSEMRGIIIDIEGDPQVPEVVGRFWEDGSIPDSLEGKAIQSGSIIELTLAQAQGMRVIALSSTFDGQATQYKKEILT